MTTTSRAPRHRLTAAQSRLIEAQIQTFTPALDDALDEVERVLVAGIEPLPPDLRFFGLRGAMNILGNRLFDDVLAKCEAGDG
jgi:hypothetical protein